VKRQASIGVEGLKALLVKAYNKVSSANAAAFFDTVDEALAYQLPDREARSGTTRAPPRKGPSFA
jgi:hypothetical protein